MYGVLLIPAFPCSNWAKLASDWFDQSGIGSTTLPCVAKQHKSDFLPLATNKRPLFSACHYTFTAWRGSVLNVTQ